MKIKCSKVKDEKCNILAYPLRKNFFKNVYFWQYANKLCISSNVFNVKQNHIVKKVKSEYVNLVLKRKKETLAKYVYYAHF